MPFVRWAFLYGKVSIRFYLYVQYEDALNGDNGRRAYALPLMKIIGFRRSYLFIIHDGKNVSNFDEVSENSAETKRLCVRIYRGDNFGN